MSAEPNFSHSSDIVPQLLSEIHPHTKVVSDYTKIASYEAQLSFPFIPDYCKFFVIFNPLNYFNFPIFSLYYIKDLFTSLLSYSVESREKSARIQY